MKRSISLLLILTFIFGILPFSLWACGGNETESSENESVSQETTENSTTTDKTDSESEESKDMNKEPINTEYVNAALNKYYEKTLLFPEDNPSYPDERGKSMTDGVIAPAGAPFSHNAFMAFNQNGYNYRSNAYAYITVDLEKVYSLDKFVAHIGTKAYLDVGIDAPQFVWVYLSTDRQNWYEAGQADFTDTAETNCIPATLALEAPLTARYVQFRFMGHSNWILVSEIEAFGREAESVIPYPETGEIKNFLFVGNSSTFYFNTPTKFKLLAESLGVKVDVTSCCLGSAWLSEYADETNKTHGTLFRSKINEKKYDYVVLQDNSGASFNESKPAIDILLPFIKDNGAEVVLYKRYSSSDVPANRINSATRHHNNYTQLADAFGIEKVSPVADAFLICIEKYPEINLYFTDNSHHNDTATYLMACVWAITYLDLDITDAEYTANLDAETAKKLRECAKIACSEGYNFPKA
ncbi:MAG: discoidin domain-containing protein [Ruminococcaceae bacterium]|nr:discoidin domain-containing protein [Oscillospiraceae bacterium]